MNDKPAMANTQAFAVITQDELSSLRAANARLQAWHDAVMGQPSFTNKHTYIRRPQPLAKE